MPAFSLCIKDTGCGLKQNDQGERIMENKKNKYGFIVLVEVLVVLLFILKLHNNLDECCARNDYSN